MKDHPVLPMPGRAVRDALRDDLIDQLRSKTLRQVIAERAAAVTSHENEADPYLRRRKWAMSQIHTEAEVRAAIAEFIDALGRVPRPSEPDALSGEDIEYHTASFWEHIGGINYVGSHGGGMASLSPDDIDWGDQIGENEFSSEENAQQFADALDKAGIPNTGPVAGPDGTWKVHWVEGESD
jgi:hypothetical protein